MCVLYVYAAICDVRMTPVTLVSHGVCSVRGAAWPAGVRSAMVLCVRLSTVAAEEVEARTGDCVWVLCVAGARSGL